MEKIVEQDYQGMSRIAADIVTERMKAKPDLVWGLATGSTPVGLYEELTRRYKMGTISFKDVKSFNLDEYCGLAFDHEQSYRTFMKQKLFDEVDIDQSRTYFPSCEQAGEYDRLIERAGGIDVQILGIGRNGHIGFNEPGSSFGSRTRLVDLADSTVQDNARFFDAIEEVPRRAVTMGLATIMEAREIILLASGMNKRQVIKRLVNEPPSEQLPASVLQRHRRVTVIVDEAAGG